MTTLELKIYRIIDKANRFPPKEIFNLLTLGRKDESGAFIEGLGLLPSKALDLIFFLYPYYLKDEFMVKEYLRFKIEEEKMLDEEKND